MSSQTETILAIWQPASPRPLTAEDAREIGTNVTGFFRILAQWAEMDTLDGATK